MGQVAKNSIPSQAPRKLSDREVSERTYLAIKQTIEKRDRWCQSEVRDVLTFLDTNSHRWFLSIVNRHARLYLVLVLDASGSHIGWRSQELLVGWPIEKEGGRFGFALTAEFANFSQWRRSTMRDRPVTRPKVSSS
jgi:hypothetical protein